MSQDQFDQFLDAIKDLGEAKYSTNTHWDIAIPIIAVILTGAITYIIMMIQTNKSRLQQEKFMFNEIKLKNSEKLMSSIPKAIHNLNLILAIGKNKTNYKKENNMSLDEVVAVLEGHYSIVLICVSELYTFLNLYNIEKSEQEVEKMNNLHLNLEKVIRISSQPLVDTTLNELNRVGEKCLDDLNSTLKVVRAEHIKFVKNLYSEKNITKSSR